MIRCKHKNCQFRSKISGNTAYCDYIGYTGKPRGCNPENCNKYEPKTAKRPNQNMVVSTDPDHIEAYRTGYAPHNLCGIADIQQKKKQDNANIKFTKS